MHIAIDARELAGQRTGVGRYLERLLAHWSRLPEAARHEFTLFAHADFDAPPALRARRTVLPGSGGTLWEQTTLARAIRGSRASVLFAPAYTAPLASGVPTVLTVHDVSFVAHPEWFRPRERLRRRLLTRAAARRARTVLTVSEFSRGEIERWLGIPRDRITVVYSGVDPMSPGPVHPPGARAPIVLFVGSLLNRRHIPELVQGFAQAAAQMPELRLILAGDNRTWPRQDPAALAAALGVSGQVDVRSFVPDDELRQLYASASVFAFLSDYEGFGFTPLEAMAAGAVPVVLDTPTAREICGRAARYVGRAVPDEIAAAILELAVSPGARAPFLAEAPSVLGRFRWHDAAAATLAVIERAG